MKIGMADYSAEICVSKNGKTMRAKEKGNGAIDAMYSAILTACDIPAEIMDYRIQNLGKQKEALGKVVVEIAYAEQVYYGKAIEYDVMRASALALINALNKIVLQEKQQKARSSDEKGDLAFFMSVIVNLKIVLNRL